MPWLRRLPPVPRLLLDQRRSCDVSMSESLPQGSKAAQICLQCSSCQVWQRKSPVDGHLHAIGFFSAIIDPGHPSKYSGRTSEQRSSDPQLSLHRASLCARIIPSNTCQVFCSRVIRRYSSLRKPAHSVQLLLRAAARLLHSSL